MHDDELITVLREQRGKVLMTTPMEQIIRRGRAVRARRRVPAAAAAVGTAAAATVAVSVALPASHQASHQPTVQLAAWTVTKQAGGDISVTIRELKDPAGLQRRLRADGVPASVTFLSKYSPHYGENPACRPYPGGTPQRLTSISRLLKRVFPEPYRDLPVPPLRQVGPGHGRPPAHRLHTLIDPSALPGNAGVQLGISYDGNQVLLPVVVHASPQCTGS
jgi:hypothetical protein